MTPARLPKPCGGQAEREASFIRCQDMQTLALLRYAQWTHRDARVYARHFDKAMVEMVREAQDELNRTLEVLTDANR